MKTIYIYIYIMDIYVCVCVLSPLDSMKIMAFELVPILNDSCHHSLTLTI